MNLADQAPSNGAAPLPIAHANPGMMPGQAPAARPRDFEIFTLPDDVELVPIKQREIVMGGQRFAVLEISLALLTAEEDKRACARAGTYAGNGMILAKIMATESVRFVKVAAISSTLNADGKPVESFDPSKPLEFAVSMHDGSAEGLMAAMHPALRDAVTLAYSEATSMDPRALEGFIKSRRPGTR